jgi:hypothetical protein
MKARKLASAPLIIFLIACSGGFYRDCTSTVIGKTVETSKEVTKGVSEGIEEGRKQGESADGAIIAYSLADLEDHGSMRVHSIEAKGDTQASVVLAVANDSEQPLRVVGIEVVALDADDFVHKPVSTRQKDVTVPQRAKDKVAFDFNISSDQIAMVRVWGQDLPMPEPEPE